MPTAQSESSMTWTKHGVLCSYTSYCTVALEKKKKKKKKNGAWFSDGYAPFLQRQFGLDVDCMSSKERWAWPRHSTPTDRPAVERDSRDTGNKVFLLVGLTNCPCILRSLGVLHGWGSTSLLEAYIEGITIQFPLNKRPSSNDK